MDILQEGNLGGARAGHARMLKDEPAAKATDMAEQRALAATQEKQEGF